MEQRQDNAKKELSGLGWFFLIMMVVHVLASVALNLLAQKGFVFPIEISLVLSELTILVPALIYALIKNLNFKTDIGFSPIKAGTFFMCILLAFLVTPIVSFVNALSQLFVKNTMIGMSDSLTSGSNAAVLFLGAIYGPLCEEFVCRGVINNRYAKFIGPLRAAFVSALIFALAHLNVNQAMYAFVLGVIFSVVDHAAGSIFPSIVIHVCINGGNILLLFMADAANKALGGEVDLAASAEAARNSDMIYMLIGVTLCMAIVCGLIAIPCIAFIAKHEGRYEEFLKMFKKEKPQARWFTVSLAVAIAFVLFIMFGLKPLLS